MGLTLDHVVLIVDDLAAAAAELAARGLSAEPRGELFGGLAANAGVGFSDGTFLELFAVRARPARLATRWAGRLGLARGGLSPAHIVWRFAQHAAAGPGLADFVLRTTRLDAQLRALNRQGLGYGAPTRLGRFYRGRTVPRFRVAVPSATELPFLLEEDPGAPPRTFGTTAHRSGAAGCEALFVVVRDRPRAVRRYARLLGDVEAGGTLRIGATALHLFEPCRRGCSAGAALATRGGRPFALRLRVPSGKPIILGPTGPLGGCACTERILLR